MSSNNPLNKLQNVSESSISGLFQELLNKSMKSPTTATEPLKFGDSEGSDFKRLLHKKKNHNGNANKIQITHSPTIDIINSKANSKKTYHQGSPDFRPVVYLEQKSAPNHSGFQTTIYNYLFQHNDKYFNQDRDELSKDIFPVGHQQHA